MRDEEPQKAKLRELLQKGLLFEVMASSPQANTEDIIHILTLMCYIWIESKSAQQWWKTSFSKKWGN